MKLTLEYVKSQLKILRVKNFICLTVAGIINAFGVTVFLAPVKLIDGGISGTSMMLSQMTPEFLTLSFFLIVLNFPLFLFGLKKQGIAFTIYSLYTVLIYSLMAWLITGPIPIDVSIVSPLANDDLFLCAIFGGMISGTGSGLTMRFGGALDGVEVMAVIFAKKIGITVGTFIMMYNIVIYVASGFLMGSWILPLYSIVAYAAGLKTVDFIVEGIDRSKSVMIITEMPDEISAALSREFECGSTTIAAKGGYSKMDKTVIYFVVNRFQIPKLRALIHSIDKNAYVTVSDVADVIKMNSK